MSEWVTLGQALWQKTQRMFAQGDTLDRIATELPTQKARKQTEFTQAKNATRAMMAPSPPTGKVFGIVDCEDAVEEMITSSPQPVAVRWERAARAFPLILQRILQTYEIEILN